MAFPVFLQPSIGKFIGQPTIFENQFYLDKFDAYVAVPAPGVTSDIAGWTLAPVSESNTTLLQGIACNLHLTPNVDSIKSTGILAKIDNIDTLNILTCQPIIDLNSAYLIHGYVRTSAGGRDYWFKIDGESENEVLVPCTCVYLAYYKKPVNII
jgi:hypothetical protein